MLPDVSLNTFSNYSRLSHSPDVCLPYGLEANDSPQMCLDHAGQHGVSKLNWLLPMKSATFMYNLDF